MYMFPYRCTVTGASSTTPVATAKPPVWCEEEPEKCTQGAKQMIFWHQLDGNNIETEGLDASGQNKSPGYNEKLGFKSGPYFLHSSGFLELANIVYARSSERYLRLKVCICKLCLLSYHLFEMT